MYKTLDYGSVQPLSAEEATGEDYSSDGPICKHTNPYCHRTKVICFNKKNAQGNSAEPHGKGRDYHGEFHISGSSKTIAGNKG